MSALCSDHKLDLFSRDDFRFSLSRRLAQIKSIDQLPEVNPVSMRQVVTFTRDRFIVDPRTRDRTMIVNDEVSIIRLLDACVQRRNGRIVEHTLRLYWVCAKSHILFEKRNGRCAGWFTAIRQANQIGWRIHDACGLDL